MLIQSGAWAFAKFAADRPLIPEAGITKALDEAEALTAQLILDDLARSAGLLARATLDKKNEVESRTPIVGDLQRSLNLHWRTGIALGAGHGRAEMLAAVPAAAKDAAQYGFDFVTLGLIAALLSSESNAIAIPIGLQQAINQRLSTIAQAIASSVLNAIAIHLVAATIGGPDGKIIGRRELENRIQATLQTTRPRAELIARNEITAAYNRGRLTVFRESQLVTHVRFLAISDRRTTDICRSRNGMLIPLAAAGAIAANTPPLHHRCRSLLSPVMGAINEDHQAWIDDPARQWDSRDLAALPAGWLG
jgi:SPP1 gp7 family putative phage head morphogenesis protein